VAEQKRQQQLAGAPYLLHGGQAGADQLAHRFMIGVRYPHSLQPASTEQ